jgi:hypothetical protein
VVCALRPVDPKNNAISVMMIYTESDTFVLPFNHIDAINLPTACLDRLPMTEVHIVMQKKALLHIFNRAQATIDLQAVLYLRGINHELISLYPPKLRQFVNRVGITKGAGSLIPLMLIIEYGDYLKEYLQNRRQMGKSSGLNFISNVIIPTLCFLERGGIRVHPEEFQTHFGFSTPTSNLMVFSDFNPYTTTGRITNKYLNNLNKRDGTRKSLISRHEKGSLVSFDFESFHVRLIAEMLSYELPQTSVHEHFGKQYFCTDTLTPEQYEESKRRTFTFLYRDAPNVPDIPFFQHVQQFTQTMWAGFCERGYIVSPYERLLTTNMVENPSPAKVFNYFLQLREMETVMMVLSRLGPIFEQKKSVITLYTYDAILVDFCWKDGVGLLREITEILEQDERFPVRIYAGPNYHDMENITNLVKKPMYASL